MPITISPPVATITIGSTVITNSDWENNTPGAISDLGNALATQQALLETVGTLSKTISGNTVLNSTESANLNFIISGSLSGTAIVLLDVGFMGIGYIINSTTGSHTLTLGMDNGAGSAAGTTVTVPVNGRLDFFSDGTNIVLRDNVSGTSSGSSVTGTLSVSSTLSVAGATTISGAATITGAITASSTGNFTGAVTVGGALTTGAITGSTANFSGNATVGGNATVTGTASVGGATTITGALSAGNTANITGAATVGGALSVTGAVNAAADVSVGGALTVSESMGIDNYFYLRIDSGNDTILNFDDNDYLMYNRSTNQLLIIIGGVTVAYADSSGWH